MIAKLFLLAVLLTVNTAVINAQSITQVSQFKLSQGSDPTKMTITWSSPWTTTVSASSTGKVAQTPQSQCKYSTDQTSLAMSTAANTQQAPLYAEGTVDSYQYQAYNVKKGQIWPTYNSPVLHYVKLTNLLPGTRYYYACGDFSGTPGTDFQTTVTTFKTLPAVGQAVDTEGNYLVFGIYMDSGVSTFQNPTTGAVDTTNTLLSNNNNYVGSDHRGVIAAVVANTDTPVSMVLHAGDLSYADCNAPVWDTYDFLIEPMTKSIPFHASSGNHEQEMTYAQDGKTIFTAMEKRYRFGSTPAVFTAVSQNTGIISTYNGAGTVTGAGAMPAGALTSTSDKNYASFNAIAVTSWAGLLGTNTASVNNGATGQNAAQIQVTLNDNRASPLVARSGTIQENLYKCQNSDGGVGPAYFRGNYDYGNSYHSYNAGLAHVIFLNPYVAYEFNSRQYNWFVADINAVNTAQTPWIIVLTHGPLYNTNLNKHSTPGGNDPNANGRWSSNTVGGSDPEEWGLLLTMEPLFYRFGVNFVFSGHIHTYERFTGMYNKTTDARGTTYVTVGTGGANMDTGGYPPFTCATPSPTSGGATSCVGGKRFTANGANTVACTSRTVVGQAVAGEDDCCNNFSPAPANANDANSLCFPAGTAGAFAVGAALQNTNNQNPAWTSFQVPSAANNWLAANAYVPFLPMAPAGRPTYLSGSMFRQDMYFGYNTLAIISRDVVQLSYYATAQVLSGTNPSAGYQGPSSKPIVDPTVCINGNGATTAPANCLIDFTMICNPKSTTSPFTGSNICPSSVQRVSTTRGAAPIPAPVLVVPVTIVQRIDGITLATAQQATNQNAYKGALAQVLNTLPANIVITTIVATSRRTRSLLQAGVLITTYTTDPLVTVASATAAATPAAMTAALRQQTQLSPTWTISQASTFTPGLTAAGPTPAAAPGTVTIAGTNTIGTNTASNACFAGSEVVTLENGVSKSIAEVQIGDRILSADMEGKISFSDVVYVPHGANTIEATFVILTTESGRNVKMTTNHILPAGQCGGAMTVRRADAVSAGDCVMTVDGVEKVMDMVTMQGKGIYTVVTNKEYIVVNGIVATPFGGVNPTLANIYYNLHRLVYAFMPATLLSSNSVVQQAMDQVASLIL